MEKSVPVYYGFLDKLGMTGKKKSGTEVVSDFSFLGSKKEER